MSDAFTAGDVICGLFCILGGVTLTSFGLRLHKPSALFAGLFWGFWIPFFVARVTTPTSISTPLKPYCFVNFHIRQLTPISQLINQEFYLGFSSAAHC